MNRKLKLLFVMLVLIININVLDASCEDAQELAKYVNFNYTTINNAEETNIRLEIHNLSGDLYAVVTNDYNNKTLKFASSDNNEFGYISFNTDNINKNIVYNVSVYSESCSNNMLEKLSITTPKYNPYSIKDVCKGKSSEIEECKTFYDVKSNDSAEFIKTVEDKNKEKELIFIKYIKEYYLYVLIPFLIISVFYIIKIIIFKRRNKNA